MKLTVLMDNNNLIDSNLFCGESGLSLFIEEGENKILFDTAYSEAFIKNAGKMNIDLNNLDYLVISHGHYDHTWGLAHLIKYYSENGKFKTPKLIAHNRTFSNKCLKEYNQIGCLVSQDYINTYFDLRLGKSPIWLTNNLVFLGEIERKNNFENKIPMGKVKINDDFVDDYLLDDSAIVYKSDEGLVVITGCSHSGICNIIEYAKKVCDDDRILDVIGGFHLLNPSKELMESTCEYIKENGISEIHPCHCTDLKSKIELSKVSDVKEVGVGLVLEYK